jgi:hypothetical protein
LHKSAYKHGIADTDTLHAANNPLTAYPLTEDGDEGPGRDLLLGPDRAGNLLELVVLSLDDERQMIIHSMRMRRQYLRLLP